jgi:hypothetical protein
MVMSPSAAMIGTSHRHNGKAEAAAPRFIRRPPDALSCMPTCIVQGAAAVTTEYRAGSQLARSE